MLEECPIPNKKPKLSDESSNSDTELLNICDLKDYKDMMGDTLNLGSQPESNVPSFDLKENEIVSKINSSIDSMMNEINSTSNRCKADYYLAKLRNENRLETIIQSLVGHFPNLENEVKRSLENFRSTFRKNIDKIDKNEILKAISSDIDDLQEWTENYKKELYRGNLDLLKNIKEDIKVQDGIRNAINRVFNEILPQYVTAATAAGTAADVDANFTSEVGSMRNRLRIVEDSFFQLWIRCLEIEEQKRLLLLPKQSRPYFEYTGRVAYAGDESGIETELSPRFSIGRKFAANMQTLHTADESDRYQLNYAAVPKDNVFTKPDRVLIHYVSYNSLSDQSNIDDSVDFTVTSDTERAEISTNTYPSNTIASNTTTANYNDEDDYLDLLESDENEKKLEENCDKEIVMKTESHSTINAPIGADADNNKSDRRRIIVLSGATNNKERQYIKRRQRFERKRKRIKSLNDGGQHRRSLSLSLAFPTSSSSLSMASSLSTSSSSGDNENAAFANTKFIKRRVRRVKRSIDKFGQLNYIEVASAADDMIRGNRGGLLHLTGSSFGDSSTGLETPKESEMDDGETWRLASDIDVNKQWDYYAPMYTYSEGDSELLDEVEFQEWEPELEQEDIFISEEGEEDHKCSPEHQKSLLMTSGYETSLELANTANIDPYSCYWTLLAFIRASSSHLNELEVELNDATSSSSVNDAGKNQQMRDIISVSDTHVRLLKSLIDHSKEKCRTESSTDMLNLSCELQKLMLNWLYLSRQCEKICSTTITITTTAAAAAAAVTTLLSTSPWSLTDFSIELAAAKRHLDEIDEKVICSKSDLDWTIQLIKEILGQLIQQKGRLNRDNNVSNDVVDQDNSNIITELQNLISRASSMLNKFSDDRAIMSRCESCLVAAQNVENKYRNGEWKGTKSEAFMLQDICQDLMSSLIESARISCRSLRVEYEQLLIIQIKNLNLMINPNDAEMTGASTKNALSTASSIYREINKRFPVRFICIAAVVLLGWWWVKSRILFKYWPWYSNNNNTNSDGGVGVCNSHSSRQSWWYVNHQSNERYEPY